MFIDERYECVTINEMRMEIFRTQKFNTKYPWRKDYSDKITTMPLADIETDDFFLYSRSIKSLINEGTINQRTDDLFNLSTVDQKVAACALANNLKLTTGDININDFVIQAFDSSPSDLIAPLGLVNIWLEKGLISYDSNLKNIIDDWSICQEASQPKDDIVKFQQLTGNFYTGP